MKYPQLLCSYALYDYCSKLYTNREVIGSKYLRDYEFIYFTRTGEHRTVLRKIEIYVLGDKFPEIVRIR